MKSKFIAKISDKGYPTHSKYYPTSHEEASKAEKKKFPKGYQELKKKERHLGKDELMGTNKRSGKVEVEKKFKKYAKEIEYHEHEESKNIKRLERKKRQYDALYRIGWLYRVFVLFITRSQK